MKKSYHSMTVPTVAAIMTLRCSSMVGSAAAGPAFGSFLICPPTILSAFAAHVIRLALMSSVMGYLKSIDKICGIIRMNIRAHDMPLLVSLEAMLDERNITRAAARLGISQPALSAQLARLRDIFKDQLLTPAASGKGMVLTPRGNELKEPLRLALQNLQDVIGAPAGFDPKKSDRTFTIGANDNATAIVGSRLVAFSRRDGLSGIRFAFRSIDLMKLAGQLEAGDLDVALVSKDAVPSGMPSQPLLDERFMMAQRKDHPRGLRRPTMREYSRLEHIIVSGEGGGFRGFIDDVLAKDGLTRCVAVSVQHYSVVPLLLQSTDLVCTLPERFLNRYRDVLQSLPLPFDTRPFTLHATWHARFDNDRGHQWLRQQLKDCATG
ncbi:LysR family transcriptional regulator [Bradyrhizobium sp. WSM2254]|uniref:LysR family transcriptional regulator n=1 Tax=Bradyrhizobium sp. WSM2254 TaxID=1188263 RepID=UPI001FD98E98|nr:LysR family transcriptional regulator [Bradyrhizobium sp. WSM2254]